MLGIHRNFAILSNNDKPKRKTVSNIFSSRYKIDYVAKSSHSISIFLVNLLGIACLYNRVHLLTVRTVTCDVFLESFEKRSYEESI